MSRERKRQANLAKKKAKRQRKAKEARKTSELGSMVSVALKNPVSMCAIYDELDFGSASIGIARKIDSRTSLYAGFFVDLLCRGIRDAYYQVNDSELISEYLIKEAEPISPSDAKKLILDAVRYAKSLGIEPHRNFNRVFRIFHDVDETASSRGFSFGRKGKPCLIVKSNDSEKDIARWTSALVRTCGEGNFDMIAEVNSPLDDGFDDLDDDFDENLVDDQEESIP